MARSLRVKVAHLLVVERGNTDRRHDGGHERSLPSHAAMLGVSRCCGTGQKVPDRPGRRTGHKGRSFMTIAVVRQTIRLWVGRSVREHSCCDESAHRSRSRDGNVHARPTSVVAGSPSRTKSGTVNRRPDRTAGHRLCGHVSLLAFHWRAVGTAAYDAHHPLYAREALPGRAEMPIAPAGSNGPTQ